jgi:hypothetical protein
MNASEDLSGIFINSVHFKIFKESRLGHWIKQVKARVGVRVAVMLECLI